MVDFVVKTHIGRDILQLYHLMDISTYAPEEVCGAHVADKFKFH